MENPPEPPLDLGSLIRRVTDGETLTADEAEAAFTEVMQGRVGTVQMAALLVALRTRGVAPSEVTGGVRALRRAMTPVEGSERDDLTDTCGTGGGVSTFNISTAAALVAAGAGVGIAKHGNRSFTSRSGSADVLEALGVRIELTPGEMARVLDEVGIVFMFAPLLHPAMRHVAPVRRELGLPTIMNVLGPLTNPAGARRQVVGVSEPRLVPLIAGALAELGHLRALVVHGEPGLDELSPAGRTRYVELDRGELCEGEVSPAELGLELGAVEGLRGGSPEENAALIGRVLEGRERGVARTAVVMNAAAAIWASGRCGTLGEGVEEAVRALDSGAALAKLTELREATRA